MAKFLGIPSSGAQGGQVFSRNRFGQYTRTRAVPVNPNTPKQREARASLACCAAAWRELIASRKLKILTLILFVVTATFLSGCATPYKPSGFRGGYREIQLAPAVYRITFRGNQYTSSERAQDFAMLRAPELALQHGFTHFAIIDEQSSETAYIIDGVTTYKPKTGLLVQFFKAKPDGDFAFNAAFLQQSIKQTYGIE
ncbi:MAG: hypothetical protein M2R45_02414 [Verrucomicrobia subdivision 3 bacterium]|nr:hypothetical protein [Limisphaerales bacterium]MCS1416380.1 hypothetical protein [Limisphaerales bacterium]